jgi:methylated-DNA-protein-cysteine methyltransferase-like protein
MDPAEAVYEVVREIPRGKVVTYGQVADMVTKVSIGAREVGAAMNVCPQDVPWQRVVGAGGHLPIGKRNPHLAARQRELLENEGVTFLPNGRVDMTHFQLGSEDTDNPDTSGSLFDGLDKEE